MGSRARTITVPVDEHHDMHPGVEALEIRELRYFLAVAEELSFTRAAEQLHLAQQALSASVRRLEDRLGVTLFTRNTRHVALTSAGEALVDGARAVLSAASDALDRVDQVVQGRRGRLSVGFSTATGRVPIVRDIMRRFSESAPEVDIGTTERDFSDPSAGLADGSTQVAFIFGPLPVEGLSSVTLLEEGLLVAMRPDEALATRRSVAVQDLVELRWLRVPAPQGPWERFWFTHPAGGPVGAVIRTADEWVAAVEAGRGAAYTMPTVMQDFANRRIKVIQIEGLEPAVLVMAWHTLDPDPLVSAFVSRARDVLRLRTGDSR